jgi:uncharacterized protein
LRGDSLRERRRDLIQMPAFSRPEYRDWLGAITPREIEFINSKPGSRQITKLVFDLASTCNMGCSYCFADRGRYGVTKSSGPKLLTTELAADIIEKVLKNCDHLGHIKFFGGEPLLAFDAIREICERTKAAAHQKLLTRAPTFNIITNGTVYSAAIAKTLAEHSVRMTVSVDGPKTIHDAQRTFSNGKGTFDRIAKNIKKFHEAGCQLGVLEAVFTPLHCELGVSMVGLYKSLMDSFEDIFEMIVVHPLDQPTLDHMPNSEFKTKYISEMQGQTKELYNFLMLHDTGTLQRARFLQMLKMLTNTVRDENLCGVGSDIITVKADGSVYSCYVFSEMEAYRYGSILTDEFWKKYSDGSSSTVMQVGSRFKHEACKACDVQKVCTHCLSGMSSETGLAAQLPDINCHFNLGQIEGFFDALQDLRTEDRFDLICSSLGIGGSEPVTGPVMVDTISNP